jgi:comEA protein
MVRNVVRSGAVPLLLAVLVLMTGMAQGPVVIAAQRSGPAPIDLNKATSEELQTLPGVGPALAGRIVEFREKNGPFRSVDELLKVRGIGEKSLERFRHLVSVGKAKSS